MPRFEFERRLAYPRAAVFDLVADVERYPEFVPGCREASILRREGDELVVEQELGMRGWSWRFRTHARLERPHRITIETREEPFEHLHEVWRFEEAADARTRVVLEVNYALRSPLLRALATGLFDDGFRRTLEAFERRARERLSG